MLFLDTRQLKRKTGRLLSQKTTLANRRKQASDLANARGWARQSGNVGALFNATVRSRLPAANGSFC
ncbi:MAG TPA: hypothetical protein VJV03_04870 [Pyrinomonadaceae bacterium]|nr:hypothetical protein [Pyrinomonadaceae bacterium]